MSEYAAGEVDYLLNHDGADAAGSSLLFTALSQYEFVAGDLFLHDSWTGGSTSEAVQVSGTNLPLLVVYEAILTDCLCVQHHYLLYRGAATGHPGERYHSREP